MPVGVSQNDNPHTGFGFTDCVVKTGAELFSSLLYWEASKMMVELYAVIGEKNLSDEFLLRAQSIEKNVDLLWDEDKGAYKAAEILVDNVDIWGNAYCVAIGFPCKEKCEKICKFLSANSREYIYRGQIWHLNTGTVPKDEYQNGGYWAIASGWVINAIARTDKNLAIRTTKSLTQFFQEEGIYECINDKGQRKYRDYVANVVNPLGFIKNLQTKITRQTMIKKILRYVHLLFCIAVCGSLSCR